MSSWSLSSQMWSWSWRFSSWSVLVICCESDGAEGSVSVLRPCFPTISWITYWEKGVVNIDVSAVYPKKVVQGTENVGLPHVTPPSKGVIPQDMLPLCPQEAINTASENTTIEGTKYSSYSLWACKVAYLLAPGPCMLGSECPTSSETQSSAEQCAFSECPIQKAAILPFNVISVWHIPHRTCLYLPWCNVKWR